MKTTMKLHAHHTTLQYFLLLVSLICIPVIRAVGQPIIGLEVVRSIRHPQNYVVQEFDTWFDNTRQQIAYTRISGSPGGDTLVIYDAIADVVLGEVTGVGRSTDVRFVGPDQVLYLRADTIFSITGFPGPISIVPLIGVPSIFGFDLSPDASQLALTQVTLGPVEAWEVRLYDVDTATGMISGPVLTFPLPDKLRFGESKLDYSRDGNYLAVNGGYQQNFTYIFDLGVPAAYRVDLPDNGGTYDPVFFHWQGALKLALGGG